MMDTRDTSPFYDLPVRESVRFFLRIRDSGVTLEPDKIAWQRKDAYVSRPYSDIARVRLTTAFIPRSGTIGMCVINFRDGGELWVSSSTAVGYADDARTVSYRDFVARLHERLTPEMRAGIEFAGGSTPGLQAFGKIGLALGAALFVLLPVILLIVTGRLETLALIVAAVGFGWPLYNAMRKNEPRTYQPDAIEEDLLP